MSHLLSYAAEQIVLTGHAQAADPIFQGIILVIQDMRQTADGPLSKSTGSVQVVLMAANDGIKLTPTLQVNVDGQLQEQERLFHAQDTIHVILAVQLQQIQLLQSKSIQLSIGMWRSQLRLKLTTTPTQNSP